MSIMEGLRARIGFLRGRRVVEIGEEFPSLSEEEISSIEMGELEELISH